MRPAGGGLGAALLHRRVASLLLFRVVLVPAVSAVVVTNSSTLPREPLGRAVRELAVLHREGPEDEWEAPIYQDMHKLDVGSSANDEDEEHPWFAAAASTVARGFVQAWGALERVASKCWLFGGKDDDNTVGIVARVMKEHGVPPKRQELIEEKIREGKSFSSVIKASEIDDEKKAEILNDIKDDVETLRMVKEEMKLQNVPLKRQEHILSKFVEGKDLERVISNSAITSEKKIEILEHIEDFLPKRKAQYDDDLSNTRKGLPESFKKKIQGNVAARMGSCSFVRQDRFEVKGTGKGAEEACRTCVNTDSTSGGGCAWCEHDLTCKEWGEACVGKGGEDMKIIQTGRCPSLWTDEVSPVMKDTFGAGWEAYAESVTDGSKCAQWGLGMTKDDDQGMWECMSVLLRNVMLNSLRVNWDGTEMGDAAVSDAEGWSRVAPKMLCILIMKKYPNKKVEDCYTRAWGVDKFAELMKVWHDPKNEDADLKKLRSSIAASIRKGALVNMVPGAGKSGSSFAETADKVYKVKMNLKAKMTMNEPENLMRMIKGQQANTSMMNAFGYFGGGQGKKRMVKHYEDNPNSILNKFYGLFRLGIGPKTSYVLLMGDAFYGMNEKVTKLAGFVTRRYDLKGESRNQKDKLVKGFSLINGDFTAYENGKVELDGRHCSDLHKALRADTAFLQEYSMIDYSIMLLSVGPDPEHKDTADTLPDCPPEYPMPFCGKKGGHLYTFALIDYLNDFAVIKQAESLFVKLGKFWNYDKSITEYGHKICHGENHGKDH